MFERFFGSVGRKKRSVEEVVQAYGAVLETSTGVVDDEAKLPFPKSTIKASLIAALSAVRDATSRASLINGYVSLAAFQPLSPAEREIVRQYNAMIGKFGNPKAAQRSDLASFLAVFPAYKVLGDQVMQEMQELSAELTSVGVEHG